jgi:hypothetical protein
MELVAVLVIVVIAAVFLLKGFDKIAGRGPKQVSDGIRDSGILNDDQAAAAGSISIASELERLAKLRDAGTLTDEEFQAQKKKLLAN